MLTGDHPEIAKVVADELGIDEWRAEVLPEDKLEVVPQLQDEGYIVGMVGDGINDAPALAAANIGIAMGLAGTDVAVETADVALANDDLRRLLDVAIWAPARSRSSGRTTACRSRSTPPGC